MKIGKIYYLIPDIFKTKFSLRTLVRELRRGHAIRYLKSCFSYNQKAIGGIKIFYQHVIYLRELGYDAHPLALSPFDGNLFYPEIESKNIRKTGYELNSNDIVIATEFCPYDIAKFSGGIKVMFIQNWTWLKVKMATGDKEKSYRDIGYDHVISCGDYITRSVEMINNEKCITIQNGIDTEVFYADPKIRQENRILCLTRKNPEDIQTIKRIVEREMPDAIFHLVDGLSEEEIALEFRKSDIFLASGYPEGLPLPPLEAMHSGCVVVGFAGRGGREYLIDNETALIAEDGDCISAAEKLIGVLKNPERREEIRSKGLTLMNNFTVEAMKGRIGAYYRSLEEK